MSYSCTDFTDDILTALNIEVPKGHWDNPSAQADLALEAIKALKDELRLLQQAAQHVCWFDWSTCDHDASQAIERLRSRLPTQS